MNGRPPEGNASGGTCASCERVQCCNGRPTGQCERRQTEEDYRHALKEIARRAAAAAGVLDLNKM